MGVVLDGGGGSSIPTLPREEGMEVILINHGSRRPDFNLLMEKLAKDLSERLGVEVYVGYNEYADPNWRQLLKEAGDRVVLALAFLGVGNHVARDILDELGVEVGKWAMSKYGKWVYVTPPLGDSPLVFSALAARIRKAIDQFSTPLGGAPEEIESSSMGYVAEALGLDLSNWRDRLRARAAYATGCLEAAKRLWISQDLFDAAKEALAAGAPAVVDVKMVAAGLRYNNVYIAVEAPVEPSPTKTAAGMRHWLKLLGHGAVAVGNSPTALDAALRTDADIAFIVATPPGFTNAAEAKERVKKAGVPAAVLEGTMGGSGAAAALFNELIHLAYGR
ncbi:MAG: precorrin-8X methylmutase [Pyrobaculum sp.]